MIRLDQIKEAKNTREAAEVIMNLCVDWKKDCDHDCENCRKTIENFLEEET